MASATSGKKSARIGWRQPHRGLLPVQPEPEGPREIDRALGFACRCGAAGAPVVTAEQGPTSVGLDAGRPSRMNQAPGNLTICHFDAS